MASISAQMVKSLREKTDLPMMECKQALTECDGDIESALEWLRKKHKGKLADRSGRATGEGYVAVCIDDAKKVGAIIELQCETAPVAQNELFRGLASAFAKAVAEGSEALPNPDDIRKAPDLDATFTDVFGRLRENMKLAGCRRIEGGHLCSYVHHDGKSGILMALDTRPQSEKKVDADLCMHTIFTQPMAIDRTGVPAEQVEKVRAAAIEIAREENKPEKIIEMIAEGKVNAFFAERVLLEQFHVKTDDYGKKKIGEVLKEAGVGAVTEFAIMRVGG